MKPHRIPSRAFICFAALSVLSPPRIAGEAVVVTQPEHL